MAEVIGEQVPKVRIPEQFSMIVYVCWSEPETFMEWMQSDAMDFLNEVVVKTEKGEEVIFGMWDFEQLRVCAARLIEDDSISVRLSRPTGRPYMDIVASLSKRKWEARYL